MTFELQSDKKHSTNKTIRFPDEVVQRVKREIENKDVSFSSFVVQAVLYALDHLEEEDR